MIWQILHSAWKAHCVWLDASPAVTLACQPAVIDCYVLVSNISKSFRHHCIGHPSQKTLSESNIDNHELTKWSYNFNRDNDLTYIVIQIPLKTYFGWSILKCVEINTKIETQEWHCGWASTAKQTIYCHLSSDLTGHHKSGPIAIVYCIILWIWTALSPYAIVRIHITILLTTKPFPR